MKNSITTNGKLRITINDSNFDSISKKINNYNIHTIIKPLERTQSQLLEPPILLMFSKYKQQNIICSIQQCADFLKRKLPKFPLLHVLMILYIYPQSSCVIREYLQISKKFQGNYREISGKFHKFNPSE